MISFRCPFCEVLLQVDDTKADTDIPCPNCEQEVTVPPPDSSAHVNDPPQSAYPNARGKVRIADIAPARPATGPRFILISVVLILIAVVLGWDIGAFDKFLQRPPDYTALGYSGEIDGLRFQLQADQRSLPQDKRFQVMVGIVSHTLDAGRVINCAPKGTHEFDLRVFDMDGKEVLVTVVRTGFETAGPEWSSFGAGESHANILFSPGEYSGRVVKGKSIVYGMHTIDMCSEAWDLPPGKYKLQATLKSLFAGQLPAPPQDGHPMRYWSGSVIMPPLEIEVVPNATTTPAEDKKQTADELDCMREARAFY